MIQTTPSHWTQLDAVVANARSIFIFMQRIFERLLPDNFLPVYSTPIRSPLKYCVWAWSPNSARDIDTIAKVQEMINRSIPGFRSLAYTKRLRRFKQFSLRQNRLQRDLIETFKMINRFVTINPNDPFAYYRSLNLRRHPFTYTKAPILTSTHQQSIEVIVINNWGCHSSSIDCFKAHLDRVRQWVFPDSVQMLEQTPTALTTYILLLFFSSLIVCDHSLVASPPSHTSLKLYLYFDFFLPCSKHKGLLGCWILTVPKNRWIYFLKRYRIFHEL